MRTAMILASVLAAAPADADELRPEVQADLGLSVIYAAYEHPVAEHVAVGVGAGLFGTYFLPWFDLGQEVLGLGIGGRVTWFANTSGRGLYVAGYVRGVGVRGDFEGDTGTGVGFTTGAFVGWSFGLTKKLDLRVGAGAQYIRFSYEVGDDRLSTSTPFVALDGVLGYRL
ncbi:MAG: hypothetical protein ABI867_21930 [Kofleriaceae bacterium]